MADTYKPLGQAIPAAATATTLYTVPGATATVISSIVCCNTGAATTFRVWHAWLGAGDTGKQYWYYDLPIGANDTFIFTGGPCLAATDLVRVQSASGNVAFNLYGVEKV